MRRIAATKLFVPTFTAILVSSAACRAAPLPHQSASVGADSRQRIENGLLPAIRIQGASAPASMKLADRMRHYKVPGVSVAVINNGTVEWASGYGTLDTKSGKPVTAETLFQAASISKPVTALAALSLVQSGRLSLDENVNASLKSWKVPENTFTRERNVTLRQLLSHSAGFNVEDVGSYAAGEPLPALLQALDGLPPAHSAPIRVERVPGTQFRYSGGGYSVVQQLLIDATGKPFSDLMYDLVLGKIGMKSSTFQQPLERDMQSVASSGHDVTGEPLNGRWYTFPQSAAAELWTTASDLARFAIELQRSYKGVSNAILTPELAKQMLSPQLGGYGLGMWVGGGTDKTLSFSHPGKNEGFLCMLFAYAETGQGAVVMTNGDGGNSLFNEILRAVAHEYGWPDYQQREKAVVATDAADYGAYVGEYEIGGMRVTLSKTEDELFVEAPPVWPQRLKLYAAGRDQFFLVDEDVDLAFVRDSRGRVTEMRAVASGQNVVAKKVK